jgi:hypothetical protein
MHVCACLEKESLELGGSNCGTWEEQFIDLIALFAFCVDLFAAFWNRRADMDVGSRLQRRGRSTAVYVDDFVSEL